MKIKAESVITESGVDLESLHHEQAIINQQLRYDRNAVILCGPGETITITGADQEYHPLTFGDGTNSLAAFDYAYIEQRDGYTVINPSRTNQALVFARLCVKVASNAPAAGYVRAEYRNRGTDTAWRAPRTEPYRVVHSAPTVAGGVNVQPHYFDLSWNLSGAVDYEWRFAYYPRAAEDATTIQITVVNVEILETPRGMQ